MRKIALDIHGVIDQDLPFWAWLTNRLRDKGWDIHIVTGGKYAENARLLKYNGVYYDHFYSITDHHISHGTPHWVCGDGDVCIADEIWDKAKAIYCYDKGIDIIVDDTPRYSEHMPRTTHFETW